MRHGWASGLLFCVCLAGCNGEDGGSVGATPILGTAATGDRLPLVPEDERPVAAFTVERGNGIAPVSMLFDARASTDPDGALVRFDWDFGDGGRASGMRVTHAFQRAGGFPVRLTVTDAQGASDTAVMVIDVAGVGGEPTGTAFDSDSTAPFAANNRPADAQMLEDVAQVRGFVSESDTQDGAADPRDAYTVFLERGTWLTLRRGVQDADADLDLFLFDSTVPERPAYAGSSVDEGINEALQVPVSGFYQVVVVAARGGSDYFLTLDSPVPFATPLSLDDSFQTGRLAVRFRRAPTVTDTIAVSTAPPPEPGDAYALSPERAAKYATVLALKQLRRDPEVLEVRLVP